MSVVEPAAPFLACAALHSSGLGGAERSHIERTLDLRAVGVVVHSLLPSPDRGLGRLLREVDIPFSTLPGSPWWIDVRAPKEGQPLLSLTDLVSEDAVRAYMEAIVRHGPDVVLTITSVNPHAALAASALGVPHVWFLTELAVPEHGLYPTVPHFEVGEAITALSDRVVCVSRAVRDKFFGPMTQAEADARGIHIIYNSPRLQVPVASRADVQGPSHVMHVGVIGTFAPAKGQALAVAALALLSRRAVEVRMTFFGEGSPSAVAEIQELAASLNVSERLDIRHESEQSAVYSDLDIVAVTAVDEGFGRVPFEASAAECPIVYADQGASTEFMVPDVTGVPFEPGDATSLADAIERLATSPELRRKLVESARQHLEEFCAVPPRGPTVRDVLEKAITGAADRPWRKAASGIRDDFWMRLVVERDGLVVERDGLVVERDGLVVERDGLVVERDGLVVERDGLVVERDGLVVERDWWFVQFHHLRGRRAVRLALLLARTLRLAFARSK